MKVKTELSATRSSERVNLIDRALSTTSFTAEFEPVILLRRMALTESNA